MAATSTPSSATPRSAQSGDAAAAFDLLKRLAGAWTVVEEGRTSEAAVEVVSSGSAVLQRSGFVAIYYRDGDAILMTLFPDDGNYPRFRSRGIVRKPSGGFEIDFGLLDIANLRPGAGHMVGLHLDLDPNAFEQTWSWEDKGRKQSIVVRLNRKAAPSAAAGDDLGSRPVSESAEADRR